MSLPTSVLEWLQSETSPQAEKQLRLLGYGWAFDLRNEFKEAARAG